MTTSPTTFDSGRFRHVLGHFATGVAIITAKGPTGPVGMSVSSFTSVSLEPPLVAFLPDKSSTSWPVIRAAGAFCVNILSSGQERLCAQFARRGGEKFAGVSWQAAPSGAPVLEGVMAWIDCELTQTFESGDHYIAIGRVLQLDAAEMAAPLVFFQGGYQRLGVPATPDGSGDGNLAPAPEAGASGPLTGPSLEELARSTGTDVDSLLRYAHSGEGLLDEIVGGYVRSFHDTVAAIAAGTETARVAVGELLQAAFGSMEQNRVAIMILQNERPYLSERADLADLEPLEREIQVMWHEILQRGVDDGEFRRDLDVELAYRFIRDVLFTAARWYASSDLDPAHDAGRRADAYRSIILHGLLATEASPCSA
jgi:flavin reductase (DIM6/NTAB) family NADH-FMN oxidoreductase RutF/AcrR family transcriptional regulator